MKKRTARTLHCCLLTALLLPVAGCGGAPAPAPTASAPAPAPVASAAQSDWPAFTARFIEDYFRANPFFAVQAGRHEFDGQMPDLSAAGMAAEVARLREQRQQAAAFDAARLAPDQQFEREYLLTVIDSDLFWLDRARSPFTNPAWYSDQIDPDVYLNRNYAPLATRLRGYIGYARSIPQIAADIRANLKTPLPESFVTRGIDAFAGYATFYRREVAPQFAAVADPAAQKELAEVNAAAAVAMDGLTTWLQGERQHQTRNFALGAALFAEMLRTTERVDAPLAQLMDIGSADLERNTQALREACARYLPGRPLTDCIRKMRADKPAGGAVAGARAQLAGLRAFVVAHHIVSIPSDEQAEVAEAPPYNRANGAYINVPGPYDRGVAYVYNIAPPDPSWSAREREEYIPGRASLLYTSVHEVWPGHFLQFLHSNRNPSKIAALWVGYAFAEGWAHYAEEMMWEQGLGDGNVEQHIGQLEEALLRDVRFISAIGMHTQGMTEAQSQRMFIERAFQDRGHARQQAARGTYDPQYLKYTLGKLMIRKMRADWVARHVPAGAADPRSTWREFHDQLLSYGGPPLPLARQAMLGDGGSLF